MIIQSRSKTVRNSRKSTHTFNRSSNNSIHLSQLIDGPKDYFLIKLNNKYIGTPPLYFKIGNKSISTHTTLESPPCIEVLFNENVHISNYYLFNEKCQSIEHATMFYIINIFANEYNSEYVSLDDDSHKKTKNCDWALADLNRILTGVTFYEKFGFNPTIPLDPDTLQTIRNLKIPVNIRNMMNQWLNTQKYTLLTEQDTMNDLLIKMKGYCNENEFPIYKQLLKSIRFLLRQYKDLNNYHYYKKVNNVNYKIKIKNGTIIINSRRYNK